jgi:hypothetical protein
MDGVRRKSIDTVHDTLFFLYPVDLREINWKARISGYLDPRGSHDGRGHSKAAVWAMGSPG